MGAKGGEASIKDVQELKRQVQNLEDENRMLKYKMEVLIGAACSFSSHRLCLTVVLVARDRYAGGGGTRPQKDGGQA